MVGEQLISLLKAHASTASLIASLDFNLGDSVENFRVPDGGLHRTPPPGLGFRPPSAVIVPQTGKRSPSTSRPQRGDDLDALQPAIAGRGELRDSFDSKTIEQRAGRTLPHLLPAALTRVEGSPRGALRIGRAASAAIALGSAPAWAESYGSHVPLDLSSLHAGRAPAGRRRGVNAIPSDTYSRRVCAPPTRPSATLQAVRTLTPDPPPAEVQALLQRRKRLDLDRKDEVWEGVLHMVPAPEFRHAQITQQLAEILGAAARSAGLLPAMSEFNLGDSIDDFRVPDGGLLNPDAKGTWIPTAALLVEILSPDDETRQKLPFYAAHNVDEILIVDPQQRAVHWLALTDGKYEPIEHSRLIDLGPAELARQIDWP